MAVLAPLTTRGVARIESRLLSSPLQVDLLRDVSKTWRNPKGVYIGGVAGSNSAGRAWAISSVEAAIQSSGVTIIFARPASRDGHRVLENTGSSPLASPSLFWSRSI